MKASVFVGTSTDGFIARANGDLDFLPTDGGESHSYDEFIASVDALVMGRHTFDKVLTFGEWPYGDKPVFVLSTRPLDCIPPGAVVECMSGAPSDIVSQLERRGIRHITLMAESPFNVFCGRGSSSVSSLPVFLCSSAMAFRFSAHSNATLFSSTSGHSPPTMASCRANTRLLREHSLHDANPSVGATGPPPVGGRPSLRKGIAPSGGRP